MKVITRGVIDWETLEVLEEDSYEYEGPISQAKSSGSAPQPVDPYSQAAAQYGLSTGTAEFNAALNRPNITNPLGSTNWNVTGTSGPPPGQTPSQPQLPNFSGGFPGIPSYGLGGSGIPSMPSIPSNVGTGAPLYTESTQLAPQFNSILQQPIDTSGLPGMPGGPSITQNLQDTQNATFGQEMGYLAPEQQLQGEQLSSQLAAEGAMPGSAAWNNEQERLGRQQTFADEQAANNAILAGNQEQATLFGLGSQGLQNQISLRNAPINEFNALNGAPGATATATTPDISGAFNQQYQGALAGYNANVASNNADTGALASLAAMALFASDERLKTDIEKVGELPSGPGVYSYRWKDGRGSEIGLVAQDVEKTHPEAVFNLGGVKHVVYGAV